VGAYGELREALVALRTARGRCGRTILSSIASGRQDTAPLPSRYSSTRGFAISGSKARPAIISAAGASSSWIS
jgi:hypothetical protein